MPKLYIFDMGGVVSRNTDVIPHIADHLGLDERYLYEIAHDDFEALVTGAITTEDFWKRFSDVSGRNVEEDLWIRFFHPEPDRKVLKIIDRLKREARVVVGTNTIESHYLVHLKNGDYDVFDSVYASHLMGLAKPDPAFYACILDREGCLAGEAVFVDDAKINVEAACKLGINAILFTGAESLRKELAALKRETKKG
jgi:HAD superfamily hydrolase (TIGR01509 family)